MCLRPCQDAKFWLAGLQLSSSHQPRGRQAQRAAPFACRRCSVDGPTEYGYLVIGSRFCVSDLTRILLSPPLPRHQQLRVVEVANIVAPRATRDERDGVRSTRGTSSASWQRHAAADVPLNLTAWNLACSCPDSCVQCVVGRWSPAPQGGQEPTPSSPPPRPLHTLSLASDTSPPLGPCSLLVAGISSVWPLIGTNAVKSLSSPHKTSLVFLAHCQRQPAARRNRLFQDDDGLNTSQSNCSRPLPPATLAHEHLLSHTACGAPWSRTTFLSPSPPRHSCIRRPESPAEPEEKQPLPSTYLSYFPGLLLHDEMRPAR